MTVGDLKKMVEYGLAASMMMGMLVFVQLTQAWLSREGGILFIWSLGTRGIWYTNRLQGLAP